jgi:hypothetical protein
MSMKLTANEQPVELTGRHAAASLHCQRAKYEDIAHISPQHTWTFFPQPLTLKSNLRTVLIHKKGISSRISF